MADENVIDNSRESYYDNYNGMLLHYIIQTKPCMTVVLFGKYGFLPFCNGLYR